MSKRIEYSKGDPLSLMKDFLNFLPDNDFLSVLSLFSQGRGFGYNELDCLFPAEVDDQIDGVRFEIEFMNERLDVAKPLFLKWLRLACESYLKTHPSDRANVEAHLKAIEELDFSKP